MVNRFGNIYGDDRVTWDNLEHSFLLSMCH